MEGGLRGEGGGGDGISLHVGGLGLDEAHVEVARVGDLVVVQLAVLGARAVQPDRARVALDQHAAAVVDVDLAVVGAVELVVRDPVPGVFEVDGAGGGDVQHQEGAVAFGVVGCGGGRVFGAAVGLQAGAGGAADADVHVPHARRALRAGAQVPFDHDGARRSAFSLEHEVAHFDRAGGAGGADLEDWGRVGLGGEGGAGGHDQGPDFAGDFDVVWDFDGLGDEIGAVVEVDDLAGRCFVQECLDSCSVVGDAIAFSSCGFDAEE